VAALGQLGRKNEARTALEALRIAAPTYFALITRSRPPFHRLQDYDHLLDGLRKAGWQG
jgi:adenylate cyclase